MRDGMQTSHTNTLWRTNQPVVYKKGSHVADTPTTSTLRLTFEIETWIGQSVDRKGQTVNLLMELLE